MTLVDFFYSHYLFLILSKKDFFSIEKKNKEKMESRLNSECVLENGNHFLGLLNVETARLNALVASAERELESDDSVPEDARGKLRVGVGKAKMLLKRKFSQFRDLCYKNLGAESDLRYTVTSEDLAGYWDTTVIQIVQVYKIFEEVDVLRKNNWEEPPIKQITQPQVKKVATKRKAETAFSTQTV